MRTRVLLVLLVAALVLTTEAQAQLRPEVGLRAGGVFAQLRGENDVFGDKATDQKPGLTAGLYAEVPVASGLSIQPELLYVQKGGKTEEAISGSGDFESRFTLHYLELPVLLKYTMPLQNRWRPSLSVGPYAAYGIGRDASFELGGDDVDGAMDADDLFADWDYGLSFGADVGYRLAKRSATIGVRYDFGLADVFKDGASIDMDGEDATADLKAHTREVSVVLGVRLF